MKKCIFMAVLPLIILISSCSKDQKVVRQLEGEWKTTSMTSDGTAMDKSSYESFTYVFTKCKVSKGDCDGSIKYKVPVIGEFSLPFKYAIAESGKKIVINIIIENEIIKAMIGAENQTINAEIIEHSKTKFIYSYEQTEMDENGIPVTHKYIATLERI
ncbi:MAG: hypothetical protein H0V01_06100 [Bacteroidetes bacterium]|nr:hypothetical protein [Bacteroidota bacterium]HET6244084.1 hypothetical protein [Bacteroidia bacterium]